MHCEKSARGVYDKNGGSFLIHSQCHAGTPQGTPCRESESGHSGQINNLIRHGELRSNTKKSCTVRDQLVTGYDHVYRVVDTIHGGFQCRLRCVIMP